MTLFIIIQAFLNFAVKMLLWLRNHNLLVFAVVLFQMGFSVDSPLVVKTCLTRLTLEFVADRELF